MPRRPQRNILRFGRARIGFAAVVVAALALGVVPFWIATRAPDPAHSEETTPPKIAVPVVSRSSLLPEEAHDLVERAVNRCRVDQSPEAFAALGRIYHGNGLTRLAAEAYRIALGLGAGDSQTPYLLGLILFEEGRFQDAIARFSVAIDRDSNYPLAHHHLGRSLLQVGRVTAAIESLGRAVALDPNDAVLHTGYAQALRQDGLMKDAEAALRDALRIDPDHTAAHQLLGLILHALGRAEEAEDHFARLEQYNATVYNDPWLWEAYRHAAAVEVRLDWAQNLRRFGRIESAINLLTDLSARYPEHPGVFQALADALTRTGDHQGAINAYARAVELDPADTHSRVSIAQILVAYEMYEDADDAAQRALAIDPALYEALTVRGTVALRQGRFDDARQKLERVFSERPDLIQAAVLLGETLISLDEHEAAVDVLTTALPGADVPAVAYGEYQLAIALSQLDRFVEAEDALRRAAAIDPENVHIQEKLTTLLGRDAP